MKSCGSIIVASGHITAVPEDRVSSFSRKPKLSPQASTRQQVLPLISWSRRSACLQLACCTQPVLLDLQILVSDDLVLELDFLIFDSDDLVLVRDLLVRKSWEISG